MEDLDTKELFKLLAPFLAMTAIVAAMATLLFLRFLPGASVSPSVVTFDIVKFTNSQRAVASAFLKSNADGSGANELLTNLSERTRKAIRSVAGDGTVVMVRQTVVQGTTRDITDDVLKELGLPTDVPTSDAVRYYLDSAPTMMLTVPVERKSQPLPGEGRDSSGKVLP